MKKKTIKLYPSNWLYNAGVIGLLKVLSKVDSDDGSIKTSLENDGTVKINTNNLIDEHITKIFNSWVELSPKTRKEDKSLVYGSKTSLYANQTEKSVKQRISKLLQINTKTVARNSNELSCSFCHEKEKTNKSNAAFLNQAFSNILLASEKTFPNLYWNNLSNNFICSKCEFIIFCHHLSFIKSSYDYEIFINAPSFKVMWYLNKFAEQILSKNKSYQLREILGISFMEFAQRVAITLGAWSMMSIEMVIKRYDQEKKKLVIDYYSLPYEISRVLLQKEIASLIKATREPFILEIVLNGNFDYLLTLSHKVLRHSVAGLNAFDDKYLSRLKNRDTYSLKNLSKILPELFVKINSTINKEVML